jgi:hypothetical protein
MLFDENTADKLNNVHLNEIFFVLLVFKKYIADDGDQVLDSVRVGLSVLQK